MSKKKTWMGLTFLFLVFDAGVIFYFMKPHVSPVSVPLVNGQDTSLSPQATFANVPIPENVYSDRILVQKSARALTLYRGTEALKTYRIALGGNPLGHKEFEGDQKTPEGIYRINGRNPKSKYHLSLRISYPDPLDLSHAQALGKSPGGDIMIHGLPNGFVGPEASASVLDWTAGCLAVNNQEIEEIWRVVPNGTTIEIRP